MAETFVFTSPGVKFKERDLSFVTRNVGITTLGLVGETLKGPAFEPIFIQDKTEFATRFGAQSTERFSNNLLKYQLPYVANSYLNETNQLWVTRVLGLSGYNAGTEWAVTLDAGLDPSTVIQSGSIVNGTFHYSGNTTPFGTTVYTLPSSGVSFNGFSKNPTTGVFTGHVITFVVNTLVNGAGSGTTATKTITGTSYVEYDNMVLATIRSRGYVSDSTNNPSNTVFDVDSLTISANTTIVGTGDLFGEFTLRTQKVNNADTYYKVSLNPNATSFLPNVIGSAPKDKKTKIWVQAVYPDLIKQLDTQGKSFAGTGATKHLSGISPYAFGVNTALITIDNSPIYNDYHTQFNTPETPWVVSQLMGSNIDRLFKFVSISDGDNANSEIKISIINIKPETYEFDVVVRAFYDTDANPIVYETFSRCTMIKGQTNYIAQKIGTIDGEFDLMSKYIMLELAPDAPDETFPAGFEGYEFNNYSTTVTGANVNGIAPKISYKTSYNSDERVKKIFLGISETAYNGTNVSSTGINQNMFNFNGWVNGGNNVSSGFTKTKGFHMDIDATGVYSSNGENMGRFECGAGSFKTVADIQDPTQTYYNTVSRKFTLVPSGGFDGWDVNRTTRSYGDNYRQLGIWDGVDPQVPATNDFQAWETAINTFSNPEQVTINVFATPGINWSDQNILVQDTIEMIETQRADSLYVIDSPDSNIPMTIGSSKNDVIAAQDMVDNLEIASIDSSYSCTYFPWIQMHDTQNNVNVFLPPTGEVVRAIAYTDNKSFPWFAPAGLQRGVTDAKKSKYKLSQEARDILYKGRISPMADFAEAGTAIFGQKTLQKKESALDRINVRRLLLQMKVLISNIAIRLVFEQNDQATMDQFLQKATPILDTIQRERGLYGFKIKMDDSNNTTETQDRNELYGEIQIKPMRSVEFIGITFTVTPSGASFSN